jgi:hypothetical protein
VLDKPVSLVRGGAWLGIWPVRRGAHSDLDGNLVIRRTFDPNVMVQPKPGTDLRLDEFFSANGAAPRAVAGHLTSDRVMVFHIAPAPGAAKPKRPIRPMRTAPSTPGPSPGPSARNPRARKTESRGE